jgi:hypothetical protein
MPLGGRADNGLKIVIVGPRVPLIHCDARSRESVRDVLITVVEHVRRLLDALDAAAHKELV